MIQSSFTEPVPQAVSRANVPVHPSEILMRLIVAFLAPMFLSASGGDIDFARLAALETVQAYRIRNQADLITVAQIIAFGLAALDSLCLSLADDNSVSMTLRLRGNANALNRSAQQNRRTLGRGPNDTAPSETAPSENRAHPDDLNDAAMADAERPAGVAPTQVRPAKRPDGPAPITAETQQHHEMWAAAMVNEARKLTASLQSLPPEERKRMELRVAALSDTAAALLSGQAIPVAKGKTDPS